MCITMIDVSFYKPRIIEKGPIHVYFSTAGRTPWIMIGECGCYDLFKHVWLCYMVRTVSHTLGDVKQASDVRI